MSRRINDYATELLPADGSRGEEWHALRRDTVTASEIAAVLNISPWTSEFDLWWAKQTGDSQPDNDQMRRGRRLEPLILEDFADAHPEFHLEPVGLCVSNARTWQACTPDALAYDDVCRCEQPGGECVCDVGEDEEPLAVVEAKSDGNADAWGEEGTDDIPVYYRCQVLWQMDVFGLTVAFVPVWIGTSYREYVVEYDPDDVRLMRKAAVEFLDSLAEGTPPDIDSHVATGRRLRKLHPDVTDGEVEVPATAVRQYHLAKRLRDTAQDRMNLAENRVRAALGDFRVATVGGQKVATRSVSDIKERTQIVRAHTRNTIRFSKQKENPNRG